MQFSNSLKARNMLSSDGKYSYTDNLYRINVPVLVMGGEVDNFVPEKALRDSYARFSSKDKSIVVFSKADGYSTDYGHCDLVLGKNSKKEVYPVVLQWLDKRAN